MGRGELAASSIWRIQCYVARDLPLPPVPVREQLFLVVIKFLSRFRRKFEIRPFHDRIHRTGFLAEAAIDALHHVYVVADGAARPVIAARAGFDGDRLRRADRLAELAGDAALFAVRIPAQRVFAPEARAERTLLMRIVQRCLRCEELPHREKKGADEIFEQQRLGGLGKCRHYANPMNLRKAAVMTTIPSERGKNTFQPSRINWS